MELEDRSYSGKLFRPTPEVHIENDGSFGVIATPWGNRQAAKRAIEILTDYVLSARQDMEATSPFQKLSCISALANNLRVGIMLANDSLYREENKAEYSAGVELLVFSHIQGELAYAQVGQPYLFIWRKGLPWIPVCMQMDLSTEFSQASAPLAPLPQNLVGLHTTSNMTVGSVKTQPGDRLIFLCHSFAAHAIPPSTFDDLRLDDISSSLAKRYPDLPFWVGTTQVA